MATFNSFCCCNVVLNNLGRICPPWAVQSSVGLQYCTVHSPKVQTMYCATLQYRHCSVLEYCTVQCATLQQNMGCYSTEHCGTNDQIFEYMEKFIFSVLLGQIYLDIHS